MEPTLYFIIQERNGRYELVSGMYEDKNDAVRDYNELSKTGTGYKICETTYG